MSSRFKLKLVAVAVAILALVAIGAGWSANAATATSIKPPPLQPTYHPFHIEQSYVPGWPAIPLRFAQNATGPSFTKDDVVAFLNRYGFPSGPLANGAHMTILTIQFVSAQQASKLMDGESVGRPNSYLVCYVKVKGPFLLTRVHTPPPQPGKKYPTTAAYGDEVFDAHTGNMLEWGVYFN